MQTVGGLILREIANLVQGEIDAIREHIELGHSVTDYPAYKEKVGKLWGLRRTQEIFIEAASNVEKRT